MEKKKIIICVGKFITFREEVNNLIPYKIGQDIKYSLSIITSSFMLIKMFPAWLAWLSN